MGQRTRAQIQDFQERNGMRPASGARAQTLERLSQMAFELIKVIELERSGIRDGDGQWHGTNPLSAVVREIVNVERDERNGASLELSIVPVPVSDTPCSDPTQPAHLLGEEVFWCLTCNAYAEALSDSNSASEPNDTVSP